MSLSTLTAFDFIAENSLATPGLFNRIFSTLSDNIGTMNSVAVPPAVLSSSTLAAVNIVANSNDSDYIRFVDSSGQRSTYRIGSFAGGTSDGFNIFDESGNTLIASFSKQSVRFYQQVVGPVFDTGGALTDTLNAATFGTGSDSVESRIQAAISAATAQGITRVYVPASMYPYSAGSVSFSTTVQMVREGGNWSVYDIEAYGATGDGTVDDTNACWGMFEGAGGSGGVAYLTPGKTFKTSSCVTVTSPVDGTNATVKSAHTYCALKIGTGALLEDMRFFLPHVTQSLKTTTGWAYTDTGVQVTNVFGSELFIPGVSNFSVGVLFKGEAQGCDYNRVFLGRIRDNQINLMLDGDATGWCNENDYFGGRLAHDPVELLNSNVTSGQTGVYQIYVAKPASQILNNHRFYGLSLEGDVPQYHAYLTGQHIYFDRCRWEATVPKVTIDGATAFYNVFMGGYNSNNIIFQHLNGAAQTWLDDPRGIRMNTAPGDAQIILANNDGSATPEMMGLNAGIDPFTATLTGANAVWSWALSAQALRGKLTGDAVASSRVSINFTNGLGAFTSVGVGNSASATTPGALVKKIQVFDMGGASLGYIPVYSTIT